MATMKAKKGSFRDVYSPFSKPAVLHTLPETSLVRRMHIRPNTVLVRPYSPEGFTPNGLYVTLNAKWARVWAFVVAVHPSKEYDLKPGDLVLFERWCEQLIDYDHSIDPTKSGEKQPIALLHQGAIIAKIVNNRLTCPI